jgi:hypothetical protein
VSLALEQAGQFRGQQIEPEVDDIVGVVSVRDSHAAVVPPRQHVDNGNGEPDAQGDRPGQPRHQVTTLLIDEASRNGEVGDTDVVHAPLPAMPTEFSLEAHHVLLNV